MLHVLAALVVALRKESNARPVDESVEVQCEVFGEDVFIKYVLYGSVGGRKQAKLASLCFRDSSLGRGAGHWPSLARALEELTAMRMPSTFEKPLSRGVAAGNEPCALSAAAKGGGGRRWP